MILAAVFCAYGTLVGLGLLGTRVSIWSLIYVGLAAYTVWPALPPAASADRARATGWLAAASMVLNAGWLLVTQQGWTWVSVAVTVTLLVVLGVLMKRLQRIPTRGRAEAVVVDATFGLYLGWVTVATCANVTAALVDSGVDPGPPVADLAAVAVLTLVSAVGVLLARALGGRLSVAAAMTWGLGWIAIGRVADEPR